MRYAVTLIVIDIFGYALKPMRSATFLRWVKKWQFSSQASIVVLGKEAAMEVGGRQ
jgi:hypothetical protein